MHVKIHWCNGYKGCISCCEDGKLLPQNSGPEQTTSFTKTTEQSPDDTHYVPSDHPAYICTYSSQLKEDLSSFWACSLELPTNNCLQWNSFGTKLFCIFVLSLYTSLFLLWQWSCPMFNRFCRAPSQGGGVFSWSLTAYTIMTTDKYFTPTMDEVDYCTLPPNSFWFYLWTRLDY